MRKFILLPISLTAILLLHSCHLFDDHTPTETIAIFFNETNVSVYEGGLGSVSLRVEPSDILAHNNVSYSISNETIAVIYRADRRGCVFTGRSEGSTVLTAKVKDAEARMVITVLKYLLDGEK
jgi:hypothetical protein